MKNLPASRRRGRRDERRFQVGGDGKPQKGKHWKRRRAWHHGPLEDKRFHQAVNKLDQPDPNPGNQETNTERKQQP